MLLNLLKVDIMALLQNLFLLFYLIYLKWDGLFNFDDLLFFF